MSIMNKELARGSCDCKKSDTETISIAYPIEKSWEGKYFLGQTELLVFGKGTNAWGALCNPPCAATNLYVSQATISNFSDSPITAEIWFNVNPMEMSGCSSIISPSDTSICPPPKNMVKIRCGQFIYETPTGGLNVYDRIVPPNSTLSMEKDGKFVFPPGGNYLVFLTAPSCHELFEARIAFGWWEE